MKLMKPKQKTDAILTDSRAALRLAIEARRDAEKKAETVRPAIERARMMATDAEKEASR